MAIGIAARGSKLLGKLAPLIGGLTGGSDVTPGFIKKTRRCCSRSYLWGAVCQEHGS